MDFLKNHIWLAGVLVMSGVIVFGRMRMAPMIAEGALTEREANRFCINAALAFAVAGGLFEVVTLVTGVPLMCQRLLPVTHRSLWPLHALTLSCGAALLFWVWKRGGDRTLAKVIPAFVTSAGRDVRYTPARVRFWTTATIVISWAGYVAMGFVVPPVSPGDATMCPPGSSSAEGEGPTP